MQEAAEGQTDVEVEIVIQMAKPIKPILTLPWGGNNQTMNLGRASAKVLGTRPVSDGPKSI